MDRAITVTMDMHMQLGASNSQRNIKAVYAKCASAFVLTLLTSSAMANKLTIDGEVNIVTAYRDIDSDGQSGGISSLSVVPGLNSVYKSKKLFFRGNVNTTYVTRDSDTGTTEDYFTNYNYQSRLSVIENLLNFEVKGERQYRASELNNLFVTDFVNNSDGLVKTEQNAASLSLETKRGKLMNVKGLARYARVTVDGGSQVVVNNVSNDLVNVDLSLKSGVKSRFIWNIDGSYDNTVSGTNQGQDQTSQSVNALVDVPVYKGLAVRFTGTDSSNEFGAQGTKDTITREFQTYGAGLTMYFSSNTYVSITYNNASSPTINPQDEFENQDETFLGIDLRWALSPRTFIAYNRSRRFYGDSSGGRLQYQTRKTRATLSYTETVTNASQLIATEQQGLFICPAGATNILSCSVSETLDYEPAADEVLVNFAIPDYAIEDFALLRRSTSAAFAFNFNRLSVGINASYVDSESLANVSSQQNNATSGSMTLGYEIGPYTTMNATMRYIDFDQVIETTEQSSRTKALSMGINRSFGRQLKASFSYIYTDRNGTLSDNVFGTNYKDNRLALSVSYTTN